VFTSTQICPVPDAQLVFPPGQTQLPATQLWPAPQLLVAAQPPQWAGSVLTSTQPTSAPQLMRPVPQVQAPDMQDSPGPHWVPQAPQ
jgi:hypothetical protein